MVSENVTIDSDKFKYVPVGYYAGSSAPQSANDLWLSISFDPICNANTTYTVDYDSCNLYFSIVLNGCNTNSVTEKWGGQVEANCAVYNMTTRFGHSDMPPNGVPDASPAPSSVLGAVESAIASSPAIAGFDGILGSIL